MRPRGPVGGRPAPPRAALVPSNLAISARALERIGDRLAPREGRRIGRGAGALTRTVTLPGEVESEKATATLKEGVLEVRLPRMAGEAPRGRRIEVT